MAEKNGDGRAINSSGVYRHKETGEELVCLETGKFGNPQADAAVRLGFEYVGPVPKETPKFADPHAAPLATPRGTESVDELKAKLAAAELRAKEAKERAEKLEAEKGEQAVKTAQETKEREDAAQVQAEAQTKSEAKKAEAESVLAKKGDK